MRHLYLAVLLTLLIAPRPTQGAVFTVTKFTDTRDGVCNADCSLREAVQAANASVGPDEIVLGPGEYSVSLGPVPPPVGPIDCATGGIPDEFDDEMNAHGDLDISDDVTIRGAGAGVTIVDGGWTGGWPGSDCRRRVFDFPGVVPPTGAPHIPSFVIEDLTVTGGVASAVGGGIRSLVGNLTLRRVEIVGNGVYPICEFGLGCPPTGGGGLFRGHVLDGTLHVEESLITDNEVYEGYQSGGLVITRPGGAGIENRGEFLLENSTVAYNISHPSPADPLFGSTPRLLTHHEEISLGLVSDTTILNSTVVAAPPLGIIDSVSGFTQPRYTIGCSSPGCGPSASLTVGASILQSVKITEPFLFDKRYTTGDHAECGALQPPYSPTVTSLGHNITGEGVSCGLLDPTDLVGQAFPQDDSFWRLSGHGGPTKTIALIAGSIALDTGNPSCPATDQRGLYRWDGACDSGAFELGASPTPCPDDDQDGHDKTVCGGDDCNDADPLVHPGAGETCNGTDDDCDGQTDEDFDLDGDTWATCAGDCDDGDPTVHPGATEQACNGVDEDCDGLDGFDADLDGYTTCTGDCNDSNAAVHPAATEVCNSVDDNCDSRVDEGFDADQDGYTSCGGDCDDSASAVRPGAAEVCDGIDNNCVGGIDEGFDEDRDGVTACGGDCDDFDPAVGPGAAEICNALDDDCDGAIDEDFDLDGDTYASCGGDCDDGNPAIHPGATEIPGNGVDENCNQSDSCGAFPGANEGDAKISIAIVTVFGASLVLIRRRRGP